MADYYVQLVDVSSPLVRETPLGVYEGATPLAAIQAAKREWGLSASEPEAFSSTPMITTSTGAP